MKKTMLVLQFLLVILIFSSVSNISARTKAFDFFAVSDLVNIFQDGYNCPPPERAIDIYGIRGEYVSAQCVVKAGMNLDQVTVSAEPLKHENKSDVLPSTIVNWNFVGCVPIKENTPNRISSNLLRPAPAMFPDYLSEEKEKSISAGKYQAIWLTIKIPADAKAGIYSGAIKVSSDMGNATLPLYLTVYPLTMPGKRHFPFTLWYTVNPDYHDFGEIYSEKYFDILRAYAQNMAEHRQNVFRVTLRTVKSTMDENGNLSFDFSIFDRHCDVFWDTGVMDYLETGFVATFGESQEGSKWYSTEIVLLDFNVIKSPSGEEIKLPGKEFLPRFLPAFENHLQEKGWLKKTLFHIADESSAHNVLPWREASDFVHSYAPSLRRIDAIEMTHAYDRLEVWVPKLNFLDTFFDIYKEAQIRGNEIWYYTVGIYQGGAYPNRIVDGPLIDTRIMHWLNYRFGITGYLHWGYNRWTGDPYKEPGLHRGDGWQVYPKNDGVINSIRWEQLRNGVQDYEYFWLFEEKIRGLVSKEGEAFKVFDPCQRGVELTTQVIPSMTDYSRDPQTLYRVKRQVIDEIMDLDISPLLLVQTNPPEWTSVHDRDPIEIFGLTEPGTQIIVNGKQLPVSSQGFFCEIFYAGYAANTIVIIAENEQGRKQITRTFRVVN
ncbi:DUF4091 domain-containing protein [candidate division KSB1 bacterium]|nr:DUF4091 domain-containing protein [candidate division KSB1 bacterium]